MTQLPPIPITGFNLCNGLGASRQAVCESLRAGRSGLAPCPIELPFATLTGKVPGDLPPLEGALAPWSTRTSRLAKLLLDGLSDELSRLRRRWSAGRVAIVMGSTTAGADCTEAAYQAYLANGALPQDYDLWRHHTYGAVLHVMRELSGAAGPAFVVSTACTASAKPLACAQRLIASGVIDAAIVGGIDTLCSMTLRGFHALEALSGDRCRPFNRDRDGLNIGEGGALLLLERSGDALALLESVGESSDAYHITAPHPEGRGALLAMTRALQLASCEAHEVDYLNAHGTGTEHNDVAEAHAIERLFGVELPVSSTKGYTGHTLGAAGATEAAVSLFALLEGWLPASLGAEPIDPKIRINVLGESTHQAVRRVMSNSLAFGGNNTSVLMRST